MENLTAAEKVVYDLLRSEISSLMDQRLKDQHDSMLRAVTTLVTTATSKIDSAVSRFDAMWTEFSADIGDLRLNLDILAGGDTSPPKTGGPTAELPKGTVEDSSPVSTKPTPQMPEVCEIHKLPPLRPLVLVRIPLLMLMLPTLHRALNYPDLMEPCHNCGNRAVRTTSSFGERRQNFGFLMLLPNLKVPRPDGWNL